MTDSISRIRTVVVERDLPYPADKIWRALTLPHLIEEWLMKTQFAPTVGHQFKFSADWGSIDCEVQVVEPNVKLSYTWNSYGLESVVTWTLDQTDKGTRLRMEQTGFKDDQDRAYKGAIAGWPNFFANLERLLAEVV